MEDHDDSHQRRSESDKGKSKSNEGLESNHGVKVERSGKD